MGINLWRAKNTAHSCNTAKLKIFTLIDIYVQLDNLIVASQTPTAFGQG